jgi:16S rRNA (cytidine1402-2'-O)-methyltransferase
MPKPNTYGKLYLIPTVLAPDTSAQVLPPHIQTILPQLKYFFVENIRTARRFISSLKLEIDINSLIFFELHKDTPAEELQENFKIVLQGNDVGIMSEAGCPGIADPGARAVALAHQADVQVVPLVGPSSILLALMASGMNGQSFVFHGYLPIDAVEKKKKIQTMEKTSQTLGQTQIFMETPYRNQQLLQDLMKWANPQTWLSIACNLTAEDEFVRTQKVKDWQKQLPDINKKPAIFLLQASNF